MDIESADLEEIATGAFPQQHQKLSIIYFAVTVEISLIYHLLDVQFVDVHGVSSDDVLDVLLIEFAVLVLVQFLELFA